MPLSKDRRTPWREGTHVSHPVAAGVQIFAGALVALKAGEAVPGNTETGLVALGRAEHGADNRNGSAGDLQVEVRRGLLRWANASADPVDRTHIGQSAYIVDDESVAATDGSGTRSAAGLIVDLDADGVWVEMR